MHITYELVNCGSFRTDFPSQNFLELRRYDGRVDQRRRCGERADRQQRWLSDLPLDPSLSLPPTASSGTCLSPSAAGSEQEVKDGARGGGIRARGEGARVGMAAAGSEPTMPSPTNRGLPPQLGSRGGGVGSSRDGANTRGQEDEMV
ncbi:unnamed protein product [Urochloa humidicola]